MLPAQAASLSSFRDTFLLSAPVIRARDSSRRVDVRHPDVPQQGGVRGSASQVRLRHLSALPMMLTILRPRAAIADHRIDSRHVGKYFASIAARHTAASAPRPCPRRAACHEDAIGPRRPRTSRHARARRNRRDRGDGESGASSARALASSPRRARDRDWAPPATPRRTRGRCPCAADDEDFVPEPRSMCPACARAATPESPSRSTRRVWNRSRSGYPLRTPARLLPSRAPVQGEPITTRATGAGAPSPSRCTRTHCLTRHFRDHAFNA